MVTPDLLLKAAEKAIDVLRFRSSQRVQFVQQVLQPAFRDLETAIADYDQLWTHLRIRIEDLSQSEVIDAELLRKLRADVVTMRQTKLIERRKVAGLAKRLSESPEVEISSFGRNILNIFELLPGAEGSDSRFGVVAEKMKTCHGGNCQTFLAGVACDAERDQVDLRKHWAELSDEYHRLLVNALHRQ
ncbi:hypothetical protein AWB80_07806 [Caballeronia pedi]|uniref:Uncharacterized protein n=1 Tax=Caballeronia pedi TaxID=1777141 RepID=A0A158DZU9_9BURK|nr:hypothetical protein [Caballeronia pedi]SAL00175.1 hypothetical protein AWB80_07806 [Caballeronia pedi]